MDAVILDAAGRRRLTILQLHTELSSLANNNHNQDGMLIATIHATKGLEWDNVILDGLEASRFPRDDDKGDRLIEEERRLFYVGMTRARKRLVCVLPDSSEPSQFLAEAGLFSITPETGV
jgi:superfamily I DNA/RNA helicase